MADAEPGMAPGFEIGGRPAESKHQKIAQAPLRSGEVLRLVQRTQHLVRRDLAVKRGYQAPEPILADDRENILLFHFF